MRWNWALLCIEPLRERKWRASGAHFIGLICKLLKCSTIHHHEYFSCGTFHVITILELFLLTLSVGIVVGDEHFIRYLAPTDVKSQRRKCLYSQKKKQPCEQREHMNNNSKLFTLVFICTSVFVWLQFQEQKPHSLQPPISVGRNMLFGGANQISD